MKKFRSEVVRFVPPKAALAALLLLVFGVGLEFEAAAQTTRRAPRRRTAARAAATSVPRVPNGTQMKIQLEDTIDASGAREGDRFKASVVTPARYADATVEGYVSAVKESGKFKGRTSLTLNFDRITYTDGRSATLRAIVVRIYGDDKSEVDNEGTVQSGSRGSSTTKRTVGGAVVGGILGGLAGGGKGVAIGSAIGAGAGAGSQVIRGSNKVKLENGTEILIRVTNN